MNTVYTYYDADKTAHANTSGIVVDAEGVVTINVPEGLYSKNDGKTKLTGIAHGAYTNHPFGDEWNQGYYEMEMTIVVNGCSTAEAMRTYAQKKWPNIKMEIWLEQDLMMSCREELIEDGILL
jgi:hypothetical protein